MGIFDYLQAGTKYKEDEVMTNTVMVPTDHYRISTLYGEGFEIISKAEMDKIEEKEGKRSRAGIANYNAKFFSPHMVEMDIGDVVSALVEHLGVIVNYHKEVPHKDEIVEKVFTKPKKKR